MTYRGCLPVLRTFLSIWPVLSDGVYNTCILNPDVHSAEGVTQGRGGG